VRQPIPSTPLPIYPQPHHPITITVLHYYYGGTCDPIRLLSPHTLGLSISAPAKATVLYRRAPAFCRRWQSRPRPPAQQILAPGCSRLKRHTQSRTSPSFEWTLNPPRDREEAIRFLTSLPSSSPPSLTKHLPSSPSTFLHFAPPPGLTPDQRSPPQKTLLRPSYKNTHSRQENQR
jgi:hypothetical protein